MPWKNDDKGKKGKERKGKIETVNDGGGKTLDSLPTY